MLTKTQPPHPTQPTVFPPCSPVSCLLCRTLYSITVCSVIPLCARFVLLFRSTAMTSGIHHTSPHRNPEWEPVTPNAHLYQQFCPIATAEVWQTSLDRAFISQQPLTIGAAFRALHTALETSHPDFSVTTRLCCLTLSRSFGVVLHYDYDSIPSTWVHQTFRAELLGCCLEPNWSFSVLPEDAGKDWAHSHDA
jgi:hypothetical protein